MVKNMNKSKLIILITSLVCCLIVIITTIILCNGILYNKYKCPDNTYELKNKRCIKTEIVDTNRKLICKSDYEAVGDTCVKKESLASKIYYTCSKGYTLDNQTCVKKTVINKSYVYKCPSKTTPIEDNKKCLKYETPLTKKEGTEIVKYCKQGTLKNDSCIIVQDANRVKDCPDNYKKTANNTCTKTEQEPATINRACDKGYTLDGIKCVKTTITSGNYEEVCNMGYTLKDGKCYRNINIVATKAGIL